MENLVLEIEATNKKNTLATFIQPHTRDIRYIKNLKSWTTIRFDSVAHESKFLDIITFHCMIASMPCQQYERL